MFNPSVSFSRTTGLRFFGSRWVVDSCRGSVFETLGKTYLGRAPDGGGFDSCEAAMATTGEAASVVALPDEVRIPKGSPIAVETGQTLHNGTSVVFLVHLDDVLGKGIKLSKLRILKVEFGMPPAHLADKYDAVAVRVSVDSDVETLIPVIHSWEGFPEAAQGLRENSPVGWRTVSGVLAFFDEASARAAADEMASRLIWAADWKSRSD